MSAAVLMSSSQNEGLLSEAEVTAVKRVIAYQLSQFMEENKLWRKSYADGQAHANQSVGAGPSA